jgi:hypothetical protein
MWSSLVGKKNATHVMCIAKLRGGFKRVQEIFEMMEKV